jgi:hypothetical protein
MPQNIKEAYEDEQGASRSRRDQGPEGAQAMTAIGYALSSEEHAPHVLVRNAQRAEQAGFIEFARPELLPRLETAEPVAV